MEDMNVNEVHLLSYLSVSPQKREEIKRATMKDREMTLLQDVTVRCWPKENTNYPLT